MAENWRRNPEHPPYALMICEAIRELNEVQGSTLESISRHIKSHYDRLPPGHHRLLPYYLNKFLVLGEFFRRSDGRYILAQEQEQVVGDDQVCTNFEENCDEEVEAHEPLQSIPPPEEALTLDDEGVPMEREGDLVVEVRALGQHPELGLVGPVGPMGCVDVLMEKDGLKKCKPRKGSVRPSKKMESLKHATVRELV